jgi:glycosyltransferase involved in cell wall biosynthesis
MKFEFNENKKILFVARQSGLGGTERRLTDLAKYLNTRNYNTSIHFTIQSEFEEIGFYIFKRNNPLCRFLRLFKIIFELKPDIIQSFDLESGFYIKFICVILRNKAFLISGHGAERIVDLRSENLLKRKFLLSNLYICNSLKAVNSIKSTFGNSREVICIENGIDESRLLVKNNDFNDILKLFSNKFVIGYIGKMDSFKHGERMLDLALFFFERYKGDKEVVFIIIGDGPYKHDMISRWKLLDTEIKEKIIISPPLKDAGRLAQFFNVGILCSDSEGFPNVLLEYMFFGVPWISTNVGDISRIFNYGKPGILIPNWNLNEFVLALDKLINNHITYHELSLNGSKVFKENYDLSKMGSKYVEVYKSILK